MSTRCKNGSYRQFCFFPGWGSRLETESLAEKRISARNPTLSKREMKSYDLEDFEMSNVMYAKEGAMLREYPEEKEKLLMAPLSEGDKVVVETEENLPAGWLKVTAFGLGNTQVTGYIKQVELTETKPKPVETTKPMMKSDQLEKKDWLESPELKWYVLAIGLLIGLPGIGLIIGMVIYFVVSGRLATLLGG